MSSEKELVRYIILKKTEKRMTLKQEDKEG